MDMTEIGIRLKEMFDGHANFLSEQELEPLRYQRTWYDGYVSLRS